MKPYAVDDSQLWEDHRTPSYKEWVHEVAKQKIAIIKTLQNPRNAGGKYRTYWVYPCGKMQLVCRIDDEQRIVFVLRITQLP